MVFLSGIPIDIFGAMDPIISKNTRLRYPELFSAKEYSIIDDYCYFSTEVRIGRLCHVATGCSVSGGKERKFVLDDYSGLSAGSRVWCTSNDFERDLITVVPKECEEVQDVISGDVVMEKYTGLGTNTIVMPDNVIPEGTVIGALSYVPPSSELEPWSVYSGIPVRLVKRRDKESVLGKVREIEKSLRGESKG